MICIIDLGIGNLGSIANMVKRFYKGEVCISSDTKDIDRSSKVILSGVGAFDFAMKKLKELQIIPALENKVLLEKAPLLGICLGMQLLFERSEEGDTALLGLIPGKVGAFQPAPGLSIPHMGWNRLLPTADTAANPLLKGIDDGAHVYFVHSYFAPISDDTVAACRYGVDFTALVAQGNFMGAQFHPERSGPIGARILQNFLEL